MRRKELIPAPIDNKNILEDFTEVFHQDDCIETRHQGVVKQAYWDDGNLWVVAYCFGANWFHVRLVQEGQLWRVSARRMRNAILSLNESPGIMVECRGDAENYRDDFFRCEFYFKTEEE